LARIASSVVGWAITAGVHSTVWILATSAALTSLARSNSSSSPKDGCAFASRSQIALCSSANRLAIIPIPTQKPGSRVGSCAGSSGHGMTPSSPTRSRPPSCVRRAPVSAGLVP
jgi:hypothetical protein